jgi:peptide-methionine (R)-S-oxide reductase
MNRIHRTLVGIAVLTLAGACSQPEVVGPQTSNPVATSTGPSATNANAGEPNNGAPIVKTDEEWKKTLTSEQFDVLRKKGTEAPFSGKYWNMKADGTYVCAGCGAELFTSADKFDSGCGWPSYTRAVDDGRIIEHVDTSHGMVRTEVVCARCGGHLGHVFDDGPAPTGKRYCSTSASLDFKKAKSSADSKP